MTLPARAAGYRSVDEVAARIELLARCGARVRVGGTSRGGAPIQVVEIGEAGGPASAILGGIHPIEWIGVEVALALLEHLAAAPPPGRRVVAVPMINVDGYRTVEDDLRAGRRRWHRRNRAGVDLNRNYPVHHRATRRPIAGFNGGGPAPLSEPESQTVAAALRGAGVDRAVSLHSIGNKILLPWGGRFVRPAQWRRLQAAGNRVAARMPEPYQVVQASRWLPGALVRGIELDWLHGELGALAMLVECSLGGTSLTAPSSWIDPFRWYNPPDGARHAVAIADAIAPFLRAL